jgi:hypothetical protein
MLEGAAALFRQVSATPMGRTTPEERPPGQTAGALVAELLRACEEGERGAMHDPGPLDVRAAATLCRNTLAPLAGDDWTVPAGDLQWSARQTLEHLAHALNHYAVQLATRAPHRIRISTHQADPGHSIAEMLAIMEARAAVLAEIIAAAPAATRAYHLLGMADPSGFAAMGCDEILIHTEDIAHGFGRSFEPPADLCRRVLARLFPWAPATGDAWQALRWANGRAPLPDRARLGPDWAWHCAPLAEWDGTIKKVIAP